MKQSKGNVRPMFESLETRQMMSFSVPTGPAAPTALIEASATTSKITLTWTDNASNEIGFEIDRWNGHSWKFIGISGSNKTHYADSNLKANTFYAYRVRAFNLFGRSRGAYNYAANTSAT